MAQPIVSPRAAARRGSRVRWIPAAAGLCLALILAAAAAPVAASPLSGGTGGPGLPPDPAQLRPYTVDDMLGAGSFGHATIDPSGRWAVFEQRGAYDSAPAFDLGLNSPWTVSSLRIADLTGSAAPTRLLAPDEGDGHVLGPWSPSGRRLVIYRLRERRWQAGVVEVAARAVRWFDLTPELSSFGQAVAWRSDDELLMLARPDGSLPQLLASAGRGLRSLEARWAATARGGPAQRSILGSGAFADDMPLAPENMAVRLDVVSGRIVRLATGRFIDLQPGPDGRVLALVEIGAAAPFDAAAPFEPQAIEQARHLRLVDLETDRVSSPLGDADVAPSLLSWSPDSKRILVWTRGDRGWEDGALVAVTAATGHVQAFDLAGLQPNTAGGVAAFNTVYADWLDDHPILFARPGPDSRYDWFRLTGTAPLNLTARLAAPTSTLGAVDGGRILLLADGRPWAVSSTGEAIETPASPGRLRGFVAPGYMVSLRQRLNSAPRQDWMAVRSPGSDVARIGSSPLGAPPAAGTTPVDGAAPIDAAAVAPGAAFTAGVFAGSRGIVERRVVNGVQTLSVRTADRPARELAVINRALATVAFSRPEPVRHAGPEGRETTSWLYRPAMRRTDRIPLVVLSYPGGPSTPVAEPAALNTWANPELIVAAGYAVLVPTLPLPPGQEPAAGYAARVLAVADAALEQYPDLDPDRLAHWGHSFGGYVGLAAATQTDRFRSIVSVAGVSDLSAMWGEFSPVNRTEPEYGLSLRKRIGWAERSQGAMLAPPWADPDRYVRNSPLFAADRIRAPVLLIHGDRDLVPLSQSEIMFSALYRQNKDARLITYWGENHHFWSPDNIRDLYAQIIAWLDRTLDMPAPDAVSAPPAPPSAAPSSPPPRPW